MTDEVPLVCRECGNEAVAPVAGEIPYYCEECGARFESAREPEQPAETQTDKL